MIRIINAHPVVTGTATYYEFAGLSTDSKPVDGVSTGSTFMEVNTGKKFAYDESSNSWVEHPASGGGGGGGGGSNTVVYDFYFHKDGTYDQYFLSEADAVDIAESYVSGKDVILCMKNNESSGSHGTEADAYFHMLGYVEPFELAPDGYFMIQNFGNVLYGENAQTGGIGNLSSWDISNGKLKVLLYIG